VDSYSADVLTRYKNIFIFLILGSVEYGYHEELEEGIIS
jgi:hypothetical protein